MFIEYSHRPEQPKLAESLFGKARFYVQRYNFTHALDTLNQVVAGYPGFLPALIEKMKVQLTLQDWEQAVETAQRWVREGGWERRGRGAGEEREGGEWERRGREGGRGEGGKQERLREACLYIGHVLPAYATVLCIAT